MARARPPVIRWIAVGLACTVLSVAAATAQAPSPAASPASPAPGTAGAQAPSPAPFPPSAEITAYRAALEGSRAEIEQAEATLRRAELSSDELQELRTRLDPVAERLREQIAEIGPKLEGARAQLEQLGPTPEEGAPAESPEVARNRQEREARVAYLDEINRLARALLLQAEQLTGQISDRRRAAFTTALFQRSYGLLSPNLWSAVAQSLPRDLRALSFLVDGFWSRLHARSTPVALTLLGLAVGIGAALHIARGHLVPRLVHRDPKAAGVSPFRKLVAALTILLAETAPAVAGSLLIYEALAFLDILPPRLLPVAAAFLGGLAVLAFLQGLIQALFAPNRPAWRLIELPDPIATSILPLGVAFGSVVVVGRMLDALNQAIAAGLALSVATKAVTAAIGAATLALLLYRSADRSQDDDACLGPYIPTGAAISGPLRVLAWLLCGLVLAAALTGYVAFATFLLDQIVWVGSLAGLLYLGLLSCERFLGGTLGENSRLSTTLQANLGLRRRSLQQVGVLASGIGRVVLSIVAAMLALAPWGIESGDIASNLRAAFFGFKVGDVTVSLSTVAAALLLFFGVVAVARVVQRWFANTFLPTTELDAGLRNSLATAAGYAGFFAAAAAALAYLGLSLEKIAIVAGALSVGIGFGLQSIVNNFVSGLILLWERPIRVGDLVVIGDGEGYVRRISVRATEIETFDRASVIIPNSNLISGVVKNRVRGDKLGRVLVPLNVPREKDPTRAAEILIEEARQHPDVLKEPPPRVLFKKIGDAALEFELVCIVDDATAQPRIQSELNFAVFKALVAADIIPMPVAPGPVNLAGLEPVQGALEHIADALAADRNVQEERPAAQERTLRRATPG